MANLPGTIWMKVVPAFGMPPQWVQVGNFAQGIPGQQGIQGQQGLQGLPGPIGGGVTSIDVSAGTTGLATSGGPVTGSGVITISGILNPASGGLGLNTAGFTLGQIPVAQGGGSYLADSRRGFFTGHGPPSAGAGYPNDYYLDLDSNTLYSKS